MRYARITLPGRNTPITAPVTPDGLSVDLGGDIVPVPEGGFAPAIPGWVYGPLLNERSTWERFSDQMQDKPYVAPPTAPVLYFKPQNTHVGHQARITLPAYAERVELGASLGLVFRRQTAHATPENALDNVAGVTIVLDLSVPNDSIYRPPVQEKCWDGSCPIGRFVTDLVDLPDLTQLTLKTYVNGSLVDERRHAGLVRDPAHLVADVTAFMALSEGDVLMLGYPVGAVPTAKRGDHIRVEVERLGALECTLAGEQA